MPQVPAWNPKLWGESGPAPLDQPTVSLGFRKTGIGHHMQTKKDKKAKEPRAGLAPLLAANLLAVRMNVLTPC